MKLFLARHGNTFNPGDKVVMAGLANDLPLVEAGGAQAEAVAEALQRTKQVPTVVCCGHLRRQRRFAEIIMEHLGIPGEPIVDERLNELDYGPWTGLSDDEIKTQFGQKVFDDWQTKSIMPDGRYGWPVTETEVFQRVRSFAGDVLANYDAESDIILAVSSNGVLRYFLKLMEGTFEAAVKEQTFKVKTGHLCGLTYDGSAWRKDFWNKAPERLE